MAANGKQTIYKHGIDITPGILIAQKKFAAHLK
jgi:hypothetical protein